MRSLRIPTVGLLVAALALASGCAAFNEGIEDSFRNDRSDQYTWAVELYEVPLGILGFPLFCALSPFLYWIPGGDSDEFGYPLGRAFGGDFIYIDPTENYH